MTRPRRRRAGRRAHAPGLRSGRRRRRRAPAGPRAPASRAPTRRRIAPFSTRRSRAPRSDGRSRSRSGTRARPPAARSRSTISAWALPRSSSGSRSSTATRTSRKPGASSACSTATTPSRRSRCEPRLRVAAEALLERRQPQRPGLQLREQRVVGVGAGLQQAHHRAARADARGWQHQAVALPRRCEVVIRDPRREVQQRRLRERGLVEDLQHLLRARGPSGPRPRPQTTPITRRPPKGTSTRTPRSGRARPRRHPIAERAPGTAAAPRRTRRSRPRCPLYAGGECVRPGVRLSLRNDANSRETTLARPAAAGGGRLSCPPRRPSCPRGSAAGRPGGRSASRGCPRTRPRGRADA